MAKTLLTFDLKDYKKISTIANIKSDTGTVEETADGFTVEIDEGQEPEITFEATILEEAEIDVTATFDVTVDGKSIIEGGPGTTKITVTEAAWAGSLNAAVSADPVSVEAGVPSTVTVALTNKTNREIAKDAKLGSVALTGATTGSVTDISTGGTAKGSKTGIDYIADKAIPVDGTASLTFKVTPPTAGTVSFAFTADASLPGSSCTLGTEEGCHADLTVTEPAPAATVALSSKTPAAGGKVTATTKIKKGQ